MDSGGASLRAARPGLFSILAGILFALAAGPSGLTGGDLSASRKVRTVPVTVFASPRLGANEAWKVDITRTVMKVNPYLREAIAVRLRIKTYGYFEPGEDSALGEKTDRARTVSLRMWLPVILENASRRPDPAGELVIGLVPEGREGPVNPGIADYLDGVIVIKCLEAKAGMTYVLLHEICHIFGAIDLGETGSVMSLRRPAFRIDAFTKAVMHVNRDRSFRREGCPLTAEKMEEAVHLYSRRETLGLGEGQIRICLDRLKALIAAQERPGTRR